MFSNIGSGELIVVAVIVLLLLGTKKLNDLGRSLGKLVHEIQQLQKEIGNQA